MCYGGVYPQLCLRFPVTRSAMSAPVRLVTSALPYINNLPHLGHLAGCHLPADIFARYSRAAGYDVLFVGGSDEHGTPSEIAADKLGVPVQQLCDVLHAEHKRLYEWFGISYDIYSRTTSPEHAQMTVEFYDAINAAGLISKETIRMFYDVEAGRFLPDRYVVGTCPSCGYADANGDQCESCGRLISPGDLLQPRSQLTGTTPELRDSEHLFLDLAALQPRLEEWVNAQKHWGATTRGIALGWLAEGLRKRSITRDLRHGVPVPGMPGKVFYVWFDAPIGYVSFAQQATGNSAKYWQTPGAQVWHFIGKDNIPFHTIFWPAMLLGTGSYQLPHGVVGLSYLNFEGKKFSKSKGIGVFCDRLPAAGIPADVMRFYIASILPETGDADFSWDDLAARVNNELIANVGNFFHRCGSFVHSKMGGQLRRPADSELNDRDRQFIAEVQQRWAAATAAMEATELRNALKEIFAISAAGNLYFHENAPWVSIKTDAAATEKTLFICSWAARAVAIGLAPYVPGAAARAVAQLGLPADTLMQWATAADWDAGYGDTHTVQAPAVLFEKILPEQLEQWRADTAQARDIADFFR